jgi:signal transduction histidine kinase
MDNEIILPDSEYPKNIQTIIFPIQFNGFTLFCSVFRDTTELKLYEKKLLRLNADKDRFISILAHDLRSPFNSILGFLGLLIDDLHHYDIQTIEDHIKIINTTAKTTYNLLEDLLSWALAQTGKFPFRPQKLSFIEICDNVIEVLEPNALAKEITINHYAAEEIFLFADADMLKTILRNLISNAIKFTHKKGRIAVIAEVNQNQAKITVKDNGIGIRNEVLNKLFDTSQVITTEGSASEKGTGLGLLVCKEFVEKHGGKIWVESQVAKGSDFMFTIPLYNHGN